nr:hypothetical protein [uncultured Anaerostipes sp.]
MCTIMDEVEQRGIIKGEKLKLISLVKKKLSKGYSVSEMANDLFEDESTILVIYNMVKIYPEDTERDIYEKIKEL